MVAGIWGRVGGGEVKKNQSRKVLCATHRIHIKLMSFCPLSELLLTASFSVSLSFSCLFSFSPSLSPLLDLWLYLWMFDILLINITWVRFCESFPSPFARYHWKLRTTKTTCYVLHIVTKVNTAPCISSIATVLNSNYIEWITIQWKGFCSFFAASSKFFNYAHNAILNSFTLSVVCHRCICFMYSK